MIKIDDKTKILLKMWFISQDKKDEILMVVFRRLDSHECASQNNSDITAEKTQRDM